MIVGSVQRLRHILDGYDKDIKIFATSGGFDPIHTGHISCLKETHSLAKNPKDIPYALPSKVVVIVNSNQFLLKKKGYMFMSLEDRMTIIDSLKYVDFVVPWHSDDDQTVIGALKILKPDFFTKGGDRFDEKTIPEWEVCQSIGCKIITGVGGSKTRSSSDLVNNCNVNKNISDKT